MEKRIINNTFNNNYDPSENNDFKRDKASVAFDRYINKSRKDYKNVKR